MKFRQTRAAVGSHWRTWERRAKLEESKRAARRPWQSDKTGFAMRLEAVILPDLGTGPDEPIVISHWFAARGEEVWEGDRLVEVLVGPATFDVSAPASGRLAEIRGEEDDRVEPGAVLGLVAVPDDEEDGREEPAGPPTP